MQEKVHHDMWVAPLNPAAARTTRFGRHEPKTPPAQAPVYFHTIGEYLDAFCGSAWLTL